MLITLSSHFNINADEYDPSASVFLFQKQMAKRGNAESQFKLGLMYETGSGINASAALATSWYKKAARQNYKPASNRLIYLEIKKSGFKESHKKWLKELKDDARFNEGEALFLLGQMYSEGTAVDKNLSRSLKYLRKAAGGNIPGSEAEIARVERELTLLQEQYTAEKDKQKTIISAPATVKKPLKTQPEPATHKKKASKKKLTPKPKIVKKTTPKNTPVKTVAITEKKPATEVKSTTTENHRKEITKIKKAPEKTIIQEQPHPMDTICGGRNRFSRHCR